MKKINIGKKLAVLLLICAVLLSCAVLCVSAANKVVYLDPASGSDSNNGADTASAYKTLTKAISSAGSSNTTVVLMSDLTLSSSYDEPAHTGNVTVTTKYNDYSSTAKMSFTSSSETVYRLNGPTTFENITINTNASTVFAAQHNTLTFGEGVSAPTGYSKITLVGGYEAPTANADTSLDSDLVIKSGSFYEIVGFSRTKGAATLTFTGTSNINVSGGNIKNIYGGTLYNHIGGSVNMSLSGGTVESIYAAGDVSRSVNNVAISLVGGKVTTVNMNNITADATLDLLGASVSGVNVSYNNITLEEKAASAESYKVARYNAFYYSSSLISSLKEQFDAVENKTAIYLADGGTGTGESESSPMGSFAEAYAKLARMGGTLYLSGSHLCAGELSDSALDEEIKMIGLDSTAELVLSDGYELDLYAPLYIENIKLTAQGSAYILSHVSKLTVGTGVTCSGNIEIVASTAESARAELTVKSGSFSKLVGTNAASIHSATINVLGGNIAQVSVGGHAVASELRFQLSGGTVGELISTEGSVSDNLVFKLGGGIVNVLNMNNSTGNNILSVASTTITSGSCANIDKSKSELIIGRGSSEKTVSSFLNYFGKISYANTIYVAQGGKGTGHSPLAPMADLSRAIRLLGKEGNIVLCGDFVIDADYTIISHTYPVTISSKDADTDFRDSVSLALNAELLLGGVTTIENIIFETSYSNAFIYAREKKLTIGNGVDTLLKKGNKNYINICGGRGDSSGNGDADITINSGNWAAVRAGSTRTGTVTTDTSVINVTINGGKFHKYVLCSSRGQVWGNVNVLINGGEFMQGLYGLYEEDGSDYNATYNMVFDIRGGIFHGEIAPARDKHTRLHGTYKVYLHGGEFENVTDICGTEVFAGNMKSELYIDPSIDINAKEIGTVSFTNYLQHNNADPFLFFHDGFYYYTFTGSKQINLRKAATIAEIKTANPKIILQPDGQNLWSPEIHYFSEAEAGVGNAGWYMFFSYDDGLEFSKQRMHVVKCLDGDNLMGRWGDPVTGEVNVPRKIEFPDSPSMNVDQFCSGMSVLKVNGTTYITFVTDTGTGTSAHYQTINITKMTNPWTMNGTSVAICQSDYAWEMEGYGQDANGTWYPKVVEGASPVYSDSGDVYLMYTGSGYWTTGYKLGYMKLTGTDPMKKSSWTKNPEPILSKSDEINGCGHGSYFKDHDGNYWVCYHAYTGPDTSSKRKSFVERIYVTSSGVSIGNGTGHPAPMDTVYTITNNPMPLADKIYGFKTVADIPSDARLFKNIYTADELVELMNSPNAWGSNYRLAADIDLSTYSGELTQNPIGNTSIKFTGSFDGNGKTVRAINITASGSVGFFGCVSANAHIYDLTVYGAVTNSFAGSDAETLDSLGNYVSTGGLVGYMLGGTVEDCSVHMTVNGGGNVGGVVGMVHIPSDSNAKVTIKNTDNYSTVNSIYGNIGGVVGRITVLGTAELGVTLDSCRNFSNVSTTTDDRCRVGGIVGYIRTETQGIVINKCINSGDISGLNGVKTSNNVPHVGGICGRVEIVEGIMSSVNFTECQNTGSVTSNYRAGGIAAVISRAANTASSGIYRCDNSGEIKVVSRVMATNHLGGIVGYVDNNELSPNYEIVDCKNSATIICEGGKSYAGGIVGGPGSVDIIRCVNYGMCTTATGYAGAIVGAEVNKGKSTITDCYALDGSASSISGYLRPTYCTASNNVFVSDSDKANTGIYTALDLENTWTVLADGVALKAHTVETVAGDIDADGALTNSDITLLIRYLSGWDIGVSEQLCDIDINGIVNNRDAIALIIKVSETAA